MRPDLLPNTLQSLLPNTLQSSARNTSTTSFPPAAPHPAWHWSHWPSGLVNRGRGGLFSKPPCHIGCNRFGRRFLNAAYVYVVPWSEFPIVPSNPYDPHRVYSVFRQSSGTRNPLVAALPPPPPAVHIDGARWRQPCRVEHSTSLIRNSAPLGPFSRNMPRALWWS